jgi:hypothetical protein
MSNRRQAKRRRKILRSEEHNARKPEKSRPWFSVDTLEVLLTIMSWLVLPFYAVYAIILVMGLPLYALVDRCSSRAATLRRALEGGSGEGEMGLAMICGLITFCGVMVPVGYYFASPWLLFGGLIIVGLMLIPVGLHSIGRWLRKGQGVRVDRSPAVDR